MELQRAQLHVQSAIIVWRVLRLLISILVNLVHIITLHGSLQKLPACPVLLGGIARGMRESSQMVNVPKVFTVLVVPGQESLEILVAQTTTMLPVLLILATGILSVYAQPGTRQQVGLSQMFATVKSVHVCMRAEFIIIK